MVSLRVFQAQCGEACSRLLRVVAHEGLQVSPSVGAQIDTKRFLFFLKPVGLKIQEAGDRGTWIGRMLPFLGS